MTFCPPSDGDTDEALVKRAKGGSSGAFDQLVRRHQAALRGFLRRIVSDPTFADDLAQETFLKAWQNLGQWRGLYDNGGSFKGWLFSIAWNKANDARRSFARNSKRDTQWSLERDKVHDSQDGLLARLDLNRVLSELTPDQRTVVALCYGSGLSHSEAAQALNMPLGTIKSHAVRGRDKMLALLADVTLDIEATRQQLGKMT